MKIFDKIYSVLKRKTNTTAFIPQIDGLRFVAIFLVIMEHAHGFIITKIPFAYNGLPSVDRAWFYNLFDKNGRKGVLIFFMISGFILAMPFARAFWQKAKEVDLKKYYLRRLTRLEPPYIVNMVFCFLVITLYSGHGFTALFSGHQVAGLLPNLGSSLIYMHNIIFSNTFSVNPVAWSLEIEVQFYLLVPLLILILKLPAVFRRSLLIFLVFLFTFLQHMYLPEFLSLYNFIQYFLLGFLLVDFYLSGYKLKINQVLSFIFGIVALGLIVYLDIYRTSYFEYFFTAVVFLLGFLALTDSFWQKVFSIRFLTAVGGMCYSIYLWHNLVISAVGNHTILINFTHSYILSVIWHFIILFISILVFSTGVYLLIEQPCMDKDWPIKLWRFVRVKILGKKDLASTN